MRKRLRVLITVKTYPHPSSSYIELVCTAGVLEDGSHVRLYPIDFRYLPTDQQFQKYQWIEVDVSRSSKDPRPESWRPDLDSLKVVSAPLPPDDNWRARREFVLAGGTTTMCDLQALPKNDKSLAVIKPKIREFVVEEADRDWKPGHLQTISQPLLIGPERKPLEKIPYRFAYRYDCGTPGCPGHNQSITDWEICQLYRREVRNTGSEEAATEKVRQKFWDTICAPDRDTHLFVGTMQQWGSWIVLGCFWPRRDPQLDLF